MKTILLTAYDVNPYKGSESGTGWNFILAAAKNNNVVAITRKNNQLNIEKYIAEKNLNLDNVQFYYFDLYYYLRFWKKGARGSSLYFYLWQMFIPLFVKYHKIKFDIAHGCNFHADSFPSFLWMLGKPSIWGPINHNEKIPKQYLKEFYPLKEFIKDRFKFFVKLNLWNLDPFMFLAKKKTTLIIGGHSLVQKRLKIKSKKFIKLSQVYAVDNSNIDNFITERNSNNQFNILMSGRFLAIKSFDIGIKAYLDFFEKLSPEEQNNTKLTILGDGTFAKQLKSISSSNEKYNISFIKWIPFNEMENYYKNAHLFLFPSHEGAGMVVVEALSYGLPVVCFDNYGPGELTNQECAVQIKHMSYEDSVKSFSEGLRVLYSDKNLYLQMSTNARMLFLNNYSLEAKYKRINDIYNSLS